MPVLQFKGKSVIETHHHTVPHHRLEFDPKLSLLAKGEKPSLEGNLLIEGDNLIALKALLPTHAGKIKCIYIDPPYNTGNEGWVYNDNLTQPQFKEWIGQTVGKEGEDATRHDKWCCMMYPRLMLLKELLGEDGVILVSIDDFEFHSLRCLMDEIFGYANHIATLVWEKGRKNDARLFSVGHEYMLVFAKSLQSLKDRGTVWREPKPGASELWSEYSRLREELREDYHAIEAALRKWHKGLSDKHPTKKLGRWLHVDRWGPWRDRDISWIGGGGPRYDVIHPKTRKPCKVPDRGWGFATPESMQEQIDLGLVEFRDDHTEPPFLKRHLRPRAEELKETEDFFDEEDSSEIELGLQVMPSVFYKQSQVAVRYLRELMGGKVFPNPKDHEVLARIIRYCSPPDALILDSFAGSGTAAQAVLEANRLDKGTRRFVLVQQIYDTKEHEKKKINICETVTAKRVRKASKKENYDVEFTYSRIGEPLFGEYRDLGKKLPAYDDVAAYIFYTHTSHEWQGSDSRRNKAFNSKTGRIGEHSGLSYYLLYQPNDKLDAGIDTNFLDQVAAKDPNHDLVVYCEKVWVHKDQLREFAATHHKRVKPMLMPFNLK